MKITNIQGLRAIAVLLVLFSHLIRVEEKYSEDQWLPSLLLNGISGVDLFFVISGFIMVLTTTGMRSGLPNAAFFLYKRASRIFPVYIFYTTLVLGLAILKPSWVNSGAEYDLLSSYFLLPSSYPPLLAVGWTLIHEMYFYYVFFIILFFSEKLLLPLLLLWAIIVFLGNVLFEVSNPFLKLAVSPLTYEFIGGALIALLYERWKPNLNFYVASFVICLSFVAMFYLGQVYTFNEGAQPSGMARVLIYGIPSLVILFLVVNVEAAGKVFPSWFAKIGDASYSTYLTHVLVLSVAGRIWSQLSFDGAFDNAVIIIILIGACLVYGHFSYKYLERPCLKLSRRVWVFFKSRTSNVHLG
jgi:exopolysaccharide production protein ExoZ